MPIPDEVSKPFWDAANERRLVAQRCPSCNRYQHPPQKTCSRCGADSLEFLPLRGRGTVYSYSVVHDTRIRALMPDQPFVVAVVEVEESPDVLMITNLPGTASDDVRIGDPVQVDFEEVSPGRLIPQFRVIPSGQ